MDAQAILKYGDLTFQRSLDRVGVAHRGTPGVCGVWSVKDIIAHLASYEHVLADVLRATISSQPTPRLDEMLRAGRAFNDDKVDATRDHSHDAVLADYEAAHAAVMALIPQVAPETLRQPGTIPWYGAEYALDDYIVYAFYGHKREHSAQLDVFADSLG
jgi:hypothetical protein